MSALPVLVSTPTPDLAVLVRAVSEGDQRALASLYRMMSDRVYAVAMRILGHSADAEEVVVDVFQQLWSQADRYDADRAPVEGWIVRIAYTRAIDYKRRRRARADWDDGVDIESLSDILISDQDSAERLLNAFQTGSRVHQALRQLSPEQQRCMSLWFMDGYTQQEIADRLQLPLGTVKSHLYRGSKLLRERLRAQGWSLANLA